MGTPKETIDDITRKRMQRELDKALERTAHAVFEERQAMSPEELEAREEAVNRPHNEEKVRYLRGVARALEDPTRYVG